MSISRFWPAWLPAAFLFLACSRQPTASNASRFAATPPVIDGLATEWTDSLHYDPTSKLQYQVLNDGRTVYVRLKAADPATQAKLLRLGFVVWLDTTGRNQQQFGVRFPLRDRAAPPRPDEAAGERLDRSTRMRQTLAGLREMELLNYKGSKEPTLTDTQSQLGVKLAMTLDDQESLIYELAVPLRLLYRHLPTLASGKPAVVGMTVVGNKWTGPVSSPGTMTDSGQGGMGMRGGGMRGGGGYGGGGGGMRGGGMRGGYGGGGNGGGAGLSLKTSVQLSSK
ncbi:hypothetical protein [Hymenobacter terricola]|uniref:hypothetical protein n=1 Tax=Hymenobacter terricola TaxID=2819236 RepID=UPI001B31454F|nr:hypothetical protein [Hymenobacter terricola]